MSNEETINWYALKVFNNKLFHVEELLRGQGVECYLPTETVVSERNGVKVSRRRAVIPSLMFVKTTASAVGELDHLNGVSTYVYKRRLPDGRQVAAAIPTGEMEMFILVSSSGEKGLEYYDADKLDLSVGTRVRVTEGIFKGSEGYIKRIKGNRRFIVRINGICAVATPYIPVAFLQKLDDGEPESKESRGLLNF